MTERNPFKGKGEIIVKDTPYKGLKRFVTSVKQAATLKVSLPRK